MERFFSDDSEYTKFDLVANLTKDEVALLKKFNFEEEVMGTSFDNSDVNSRTDLIIKGFIYERRPEDMSYYQGTIFYKQIKDKL